MRRIKEAVLTVGRHLDDRQLAHLRSVLGYLEIGALVERLGIGGEVPSLPARTDVFARALREVRGEQPLYLEFGVFEGATMRWWSQHLTQPSARLVGFDSFVGLPEEWRPGYDAGAFDTPGPPEIGDARVSFVQGWFAETLPAFVLPPHDQLIVNVDCDLYSSAATVLTWVEPHLAAGSLLYFDELSDHDHELRALEELRARGAVDLVPLALGGGGTHALFRVESDATRDG
jgi:hypothetical protein